MRRYCLASIGLVVVTAACGETPPHQRQGPPANQGNGSQSIVGRWQLVTLLRNGEDWTNRGGAIATAVAYYTFDAQGTFRIVLGDSVRETGTWSVDTTVSPRIFDHIPDVDGKSASYVAPGIFAIDGDTLRISLIPPNRSRKHPTQFRSSPTDSSWLLVFSRAKL